MIKVNIFELYYVMACIKLGVSSKHVRDVVSVMKCYPGIGAALLPFNSLVMMQFGS